LYTEYISCRNCARYHAERPAKHSKVPIITYRVPTFCVSRARTTWFATSSRHRSYCRLCNSASLVRLQFSVSRSRSLSSSVFCTSPAPCNNQQVLHRQDHPLSGIQTAQATEPKIRYSIRQELTQFLLFSSRHAKRWQVSRTDGNTLFPQGSIPFILFTCSVCVDAVHNADYIVPHDGIPVNT